MSKHRNALIKTVALFTWHPVSAGMTGSAGSHLGSEVWNLDSNHGNVVGHWTRGQDPGEPVREEEKVKAWTAPPVEKRERKIFTHYIILFNASL